MKKFYDAIYDYGGGGSYTDKRDNILRSRALLLEIIMNQYGINDSDLEDISIVKSKLRDIKIDQILK
jgi:hypothetical protein